MKLQNTRLLLIAPVLAVAGCSDIAYQTPLVGEFEEAEKFAVDLALVVDYQDKSFTGVMRNFQFPRTGFNTPSGDVEISGVVTQNDDGQKMLDGTGTGVLVDGDREYLLEIELQSYYIYPGGSRVIGGYWGGGSFNERGEYRDWYSIKGRFDANVTCPTALNLGPCTLTADPA